MGCNSISFADRRCPLAGPHRLFFLVLLGTSILEGTPVIKLNAPLVSGGDVSLVRLSPAGDRAVYRADQDLDGVDELYSASLSGGPVVKLNPALMQGRRVSSSFRFSPDADRVVFLADVEVYGTVDLYSVPVDGGGAIKLNEGQTPGFDVYTDFLVSPDSSRVIYRVSNSFNAPDELYSVLIGGGERTRLDAGVPGLLDVANGPQVTADGSRVVFMSRKAGALFELYSVPVEGGSVVKLTPPLVSGGRVFDFELSGDRVVYSAEQDEDGILEIFTVPVMGGVAVKLNDPLGPGDEVHSHFQIAPDGSRVVFLVDRATGGTRELFSVPLMGGSPLPLSGALPAGQAVAAPIRTAPFLISADSGWVVYGMEDEGLGVAGLFSVPLAGGSPVKLNGNLLPGGTIKLPPVLSASGGQVLFEANQLSVSRKDLFSVPINGGTAVRLNFELPVGGAISGIQTVGDRALFLAGRNDPQMPELFRVSLAGEDAVRINANLVTGGRVAGAQTTGDGSHAVYLAEQETNGVMELYAVPLAATSLEGFLARHGMASLEAEDDGDATPALLEYLSLGNPRLNDNSLGLEIDVGGRLTWMLAPEAGREFRLIVEGSASLGDLEHPWTPLAVREAGAWSGAFPLEEFVGGGLAAYSFDIAAFPTRRFFRLRVEP